MNIHQEQTRQLKDAFSRWDMILKENEEIIKRFEMTAKEYQDELDRRYDDGR